MQDTAAVFLRQPQPQYLHIHPPRPPRTRHPQRTPRPTSSIPTLEPETLERLEINTGQTLQLQPGESYQLKLGTTECCYVFVDAPVEAAWTISPQKGVKLDPVSGLLEVSPGAEHGTSYTITANVENSRKVLITPLLIYTPEGNPLAGTWHRSRGVPMRGRGGNNPARCPHRTGAGGGRHDQGHLVPL